jgi:hypothetical protein
VTHNPSVRINERQQPFIRQSVQLTGLNCDEFQAGIDTLQCLHQILSRQVSEGTMEPFSFGQVGHFNTLDISTRYFSSRYDDPFGEPIQFERTVDPNGILARMSNSKYFHGEDNQVLYYGLKINGDDETPM